jgi:hypothetical protein
MELQQICTPFLLQGFGILNTRWASCRRHWFARFKIKKTEDEQRWNIWFARVGSPINESLIRRVTNKCSPHVHNLPTVNVFKFRGLQRDNACVGDVQSDDKVLVKILAKITEISAEVTDERSKLRSEELYIFCVIPVRLAKEPVRWMEWGSSNRT